LFNPSQGGRGSQVISNLTILGNCAAVFVWESGFGIHSKTTAGKHLPQQAPVGAIVAILVGLDYGIPSSGNYERVVDISYQ